MSDHLPTKCYYCGRPFTPTDLHHSQKLLNRLHNDRRLDFCGLACRRAVIESHVAFEDKHVSWNPDLHGATEPAPDFDEIPKAAACAIQGLEPEQVERLVAFMAAWLHLTPIQQAVTLAALYGGTGAQVARDRGVSAQAVSQALKQSRKKCRVLEKAIPRHDEAAHGVAEVLPPPGGGRLGPVGGLPDLPSVGMLLNPIGRIVPNNEKTQ